MSRLTEDQLDGQLESDEGQAIVKVLENPTTRAVLTVMGDEPLTAREISQRANIPLSSVYRALNELESADFVRDAIRLVDSGQHVTEFQRTIDEVTIRFSDQSLISTTTNRTASDS